MRQGIGATVFMLLLWQGIVWVTGWRPFILPGPLRVAETWWENRVLIWEHTQTTLIEIGLGLALGSGLGIVLAILMALSPVVRTNLRPVLVFSQALPVFALAPILVLWLGYGLESKVAMAILIVFFPVVSSFFDGLMRTPPGYLDLAETMGARPLQLMLRVRVPAALPALGSGLKLAAVYAPIGAVIGEWVGSAGGLGYLMLLASGRAKTDLMFAAVLTLGVLSVTLYLVADRATRRLGRHGP